AADGDPVWSAQSAEEVLGMPVRLGFPVGVRGIVQLVQGPQYATGVGLVRYGAQQLLDHQVRQGALPVTRPAAEAAPEREARKGRRFLDWLRDAF
ncbi:MAG TPA: hypothetical protein PLU22_18435, partial [Polyangiaceae bacterium]|nr:hypothetical protein [Polyangiaceae bacterium]